MSRKVLHIISQAHIDPVWLWPWRDGCSETLTTLQSALDRMEETPGFCFTNSSAALYRWVEEMDPRLFGGIRRRMNEGRWEVAGGWVCEPDCNIPSTESLVRHCLYGKRYLRRTLGVEVTVGYNVDSFGHGAGLPQILARCGFRYYVFMRPGPHERPLPLLFRWESADGSGVLAWRIPGAYCQSPRCTPGRLEELVRKAAAECFAPGFEDGAFFLGVGNHGGGPTRAHIRKILELRGDESLPELRFSTLGAFFGRLEQSPAIRDVPVIRGELQHHARGCYSAMSEVKRMNRAAERALVQGETLAALAARHADAAYPGEALREAWWEALFNQFHDTLAGSSTQPCYEDARDSLGAARAAGRRAAVGAAHVLARRVDTSAAVGGVLFLMNPLPWKRPALVQLDTARAPHGDDPITHLLSCDGEKLPVQWAAADASFGPHGLEWKKLTAVVDLPACGYRAFHLAQGEPPAAVKWTCRATTGESCLGLTSLKTSDGREMLSAPAGLVVLEDTSDTWGHGVTEYRGVIGRPALTGSRVIEDGPLLRTVRQKGRWGSSEIVLDVTCWRLLDAVELRLRVNWQERSKILKLEIPTLLEGVRHFAKAPGGAAEREPNGEEEPCQDWVAVEGTLDGERCALGLVNDGTHSYDCLGGLLRAVVLRSPRFAQHDPVRPPEDSDYPFQDQGWHEKRFWLMCGSGGWQALNLPRRAEELQTPAEYVMDSAHAGAEPWERSLLEIEPESVVMTALKRAEDGDGVILRLQETAGRAADATVRASGVRAEGRLSLGPWQMGALRLFAARGQEIREAGMLD